MTMPAIRKPLSQVALHLAIAAIVASTPIAAQTVPQIPALPQPVSAPGTNRSQVPPAPASSAGSDLAEHTALVRATLSALNDANLTGNYSVLRDAAAPAFAERYSAADLAVAFTSLRNNPAFAPASQGVPRLVEVLKSAAGTLALRGHVPARPGNLEFNAQYQRFGNRWRLNALSVSLPAPKSAQMPPAR